LDGSSSYSLADASSAVSCLWQQIGGPSSVVWTNPTSLVAMFSGLIFGTYDFSLQVRDVAGNTATAPIQIGAVATDDNGVVVNADPNVDLIFGPMIAFGKNPWGYADERAMTATQLRMAAYNAQGLNPPSWTTAATGAVSYTFNGMGPAGAPATTLSSAIGSTGTLRFSAARCEAGNIRFARTEKLQKVHARLFARLANTQKDEVFFNPFRRRETLDHTAEPGKCFDRVLGVVVIPRDAIVAQKGEQLVAILI
jgi:hypothetical protein